MSKNKKIDFEASMKRLDEITQELSKDTVKLEEALSLYQEGVGIVRDCNSMLEDTQRKIKMLKLSVTGEISEEGFEASVSD